MLYRFIVLLHLTSSLLHIRPVLVSCAYVSIESIDCILLSSFKLKAILLISSVKTLCVFLLNICSVFNITLLLFMNSLRLSTSILFFSKSFVLFSIWAASKQFLCSWNLRFFMTQVFVLFAFSSSSLLSFK